MIIKKLFLIVIQLIIVVYLVIIAYFYFMQDNYIYYPQKITKAYADMVTKSDKNIEEVIIETADKSKLHGWLSKLNNTKSPLVIYFGGNAEEVSYLVKDQKFKGYSILTMNYRGFGLSEGKPSEKSFFSDALEIYDYALKRPDIDKNNIVIMGRSLGTGVATYLASERNCKAVILTSPYDSINSVAQEQMPFLPIELISKNKFNSMALAPKIKYPLLALLAKKDTTIPNWHSKKLIASWAGKNQYAIFDKEDHDSIIFSDTYWKTINDFLNTINRK